MTELLSINEAAKALGVSRRTMYRLLEDGRVVGYMVGKRTKIPKVEIDTYLQKNKKEVK